MSATKPTTNEQMRVFAQNLARECTDHTQWLAVIRYGLGFLLDNQPLLIELLTWEATKLANNKGAEGSMCEETRRVFDELGLRIVLKDSA